MTVFDRPSNGQRADRLTHGIVRRSTICVALFAAMGALSGARGAEPWRELNELVRQWNALERQSSVVEARWRERRPLLDLQLDLLERERESLSDFMETRRSASDQVDQRRIELAAQQAALEENQQTLDAALADARRIIERLLPRVPPPLQSEWREQLATLGSNDATDASRRLQSLVAMLTAAEEFDQRITVHRTTMTDAAGSTIEVRQLYLGLAQGWYVSADRRLAGQGHPGRNEWVWVDRSSDADFAADRLLGALDMIENPARATPVALPVEFGRQQP